MNAPTSTASTGPTPRTTSHPVIRRLAPAVGLVAVVTLAAGTGSAVAAKMITGADIENNTVTTRDIKNSSLKGKDVKAGSLAESKLAASVTSKLNAPSIAGFEVVSETVELGTASGGTVFVACTPGKIALAGGASFETTEFDAVIQESVPQKTIGEFFAPVGDGVANAWAITGTHNGLDPVDLTGYAICVDPG